MMLYHSSSLCMQTDIIAFHNLFPRAFHCQQILHYFTFTAAPRFAFPLEDQFIILTTDQPQADVIVSCSAYAMPVVNITWSYFTLDGEATILSNTLERINIEQVQEGFITTSTLTISDATFADRGVFMCDAGNEHGDISANAALTVYGESLNS